MNRRNHPTRAGVTAVEFAMVAPLLFICIFAGVEFVRANVIRHTAENAAYYASRVVIVPGANKQEAIDKANSILAMAGIRNAEITFTPDVITEDTKFVATQISVPMNSNSWGIGMFTQGRAIVAESKLRTERSPVIQAKALPTILNPPPPPPPPEPEPEPEPTPEPEPEPEPEPNYDSDDDSDDDDSDDDDDDSNEQAPPPPSSPPPPPPPPSPPPILL